MLRVILTIVQVFASLAIIGLVLLQRGKGAEAGAGFGAGASGTVFGARGASTALSRATAIFAAIFMITLEGVVDVVWSPSWSVVVFYGALVLVLAFRPQGLFGRKAARAQ